MKKKYTALILTSNRLRHGYFSCKINQYFDVLSVFVEEKRNYYLKQNESSILIREHFKHIADYENSFFNEFDIHKELNIKAFNDINSQNCVDLAMLLNPDVVCLYGTSILKEAWLNAFPLRIVNLHLGMSPFYRGSATLFWPFVKKELQYLGTSVHLATEEVDAGNIIKRIDSDILPNENYYEITTKLIKKSIDLFPFILNDYLDGNLIAFPQEDFPTRSFKKIDFTEAALSQALLYSGSGFNNDEISKILKAKKCRFSL